MTESGCLEVREDAGLRWMHYNNGSVESVMSLEDPSNPVLAYAQAMMSFLLFQQQPENILNLGLGGGSVIRFCDKYLPKSNITTVEINPDVAEVCHQYFATQTRASNLILDDGQHYLSKLARNRSLQNKSMHNNNLQNMGHNCDLGYDTILVDLFQACGMADCVNNNSFYNDCFNCLAPNGVMVLNLIVNDIDQMTDLLSKVWQSFSGKVICFSLDNCSNIIVLAFREQFQLFPHQQLKLRAVDLQNDTQLAFTRYADSILKNNRW
ncbi:MAG: hypothetical protein JKY67_11695 [Pseudomonadales bacterium]|nr:hypothetical protein [Pseudomonadales bacterium]